jgi:segregation and condensation protein B
MRCRCRSALESLLLVADAPVEAPQLAAGSSRCGRAGRQHSAASRAGYQAAGRGLRLAERDGRFQLAAPCQAASALHRRLPHAGGERPRRAARRWRRWRSRPIVQPATRAPDSRQCGAWTAPACRVRLLQRGLLEEFDRLGAPGRPVRYGVTELFMHHFALIPAAGACPSRSGLKTNSSTRRWPRREP